MTGYGYIYDPFDGMTREDELALLRAVLKGWKWPASNEFTDELDRMRKEEDDAREERDEEDKQNEETFSIKR